MLPTGDCDTMIYIRGIAYAHSQCRGVLIDRYVAHSLTHSLVDIFSLLEISDITRQDREERYRLSLTIHSICSVGRCEHVSTKQP